jgi:lysophospholipase L1-like esterase
MTTEHLRPWLPLFTLVGLVACTAAPTSDLPQGSGGTQAVGSGSGGSGGSGAPTVNPPKAGTTGSAASMGSGGTVTSTGGDTGLSGTAGTADISGAAGTGPNTSGTAGSDATGTAGATGEAGTAGTAGATGAAGAAPPPPPPTPGTIPAGYPAATAANAAMCKPVGLTAGLCPGGGPGPMCLQCLFGGTTYNQAQSPTTEGTMEAGNYLVTVKLGGATAGDTYVGAESSRGLLPTVTTAAGQMLDYAFVVNARPMEGQPNHAGGPGGYPGLDLFFSGKNPQVSAIGYALATAATKPVMVYIAGDSTVCDQTGNVFGGWGQMLPEFFNAPVGISNYANSGASSSSFNTYWSQIKAKWTAGDFVFIQFGHNDKGVADATVQANLEKFAADAIAANVTPILVSPPARVQFPSGGTMDGSQASLHAVSAQGAAKATGAAYIDLTALSTAWYNTLGSQAAALKFHAGGTDATHTNLAGAEKLAGFLAAEIKSQNLPLAKYLR